MAVHMLTTADNPYNPFTQFDLWFAFDEQKGYHTCSYLARIVDTFGIIDELDSSLERELAIDEIIDFNLLGIYRKVTQENFDEIMNKDLSDSEKEALIVLNNS